MYRYKYVIIYCYVVPTILLCLFVIICRPKDASVVHSYFCLDSSGFMTFFISLHVHMQLVKSLSSYWRTLLVDLALVSLNYVNTRKSKKYSLLARWFNLSVLSVLLEMLQSVTVLYDSMDFKYFVGARHL